MQLVLKRSAARLGALLLLVGASAASGADWYISIGGSDSNNGSIGSPYATIGKAISSASAGDTIYMRGGTYNLTSTVTISKAGTAALPFTLQAYPGETPILDFNGQGAGQRGIQLNTNYWQIKGLTIQRARDNGIFVSGSNNVLERLVTRQNQDSGVQISASGGRIPSNNLVLNTDSYENYDIGNNGENADGFAVKFRDLGPGNVLKGVRAWSNSDDGFDFWQAEHGVTVINSWAYRNGYNIWNNNNFAGDGNGIKLGHDSGKHVLKNMLIWDHPANGVDVNGNATQLESPNDPIAHGVEVYNVTAYDNGSRNFRFDESFAHIVRNNISLAGSVTMFAGVIHDHNSWNGGSLSVDANDFITLDDTSAIGARLPDGSLPISGFLRLRPDSNAIDKGVNVGIGYNGIAPDLGAFEYGTPKFGDADLDGDVDGVDVGIWAQNFTGELGLAGGATWIQGDWDFDGDVDGIDVGLWALNFTGELGGGGLSAVVVRLDAPNSEPARILRELGVTVIPEPRIIACLPLLGAILRLTRRR